MSEKSRGYAYSGVKFSTIKCRKCENVKPIWYFGISERTGERRKICKACRARLKHTVKVDPDERFVGVFDGLELNPIWDLNSNRTAQAMIGRRAEAVKDLLAKEMKEKKPQGNNIERTIADEIKAGKRAWRAVRQLAWAPIPLILPESD